MFDHNENQQNRFLFNGYDAGSNAQTGFAGGFVATAGILTFLLRNPILILIVIALIIAHKYHLLPT